MTGAERSEDEYGSRTYVYPPTGELLDSVTTVISGTDAKPWLTGWSGGVSMAWAIDNMSLIARTLRDNGDDGRAAAINLGKDAAEKIRALKADAGSYVHDVQEALILWAVSRGQTGANIALPILPDHLVGALYDGEPLTDVVDFMVDGFIAFVSHFNPQFLATEMPVYNQPLGYAGTLDMIIALTGYGISFGTGPRGEDQLVPSPGNVLVPCVDTKTGREPAGTWKEQLAAYRRAKECMPSKLDGVRPMLATDCALVLHLRPEYPDGYLLMLVSASEDEAAWARFERAISIYRERQTVKNKPGTSIRPLRVDGTMPGPRLCDLAAEGYGRALAPLRKALGAGTELDDLARFNEDEILAVKGVGPKLLDTIRVMLADHGLRMAGETPPVKAAA